MDKPATASPSFIASPARDHLGFVCRLSGTDATVACVEKARADRADFDAAWAAQRKAATRAPWNRAAANRARRERKAAREAAV